MFIVMEPTCPREQAERVLGCLSAMQARGRLSSSPRRPVIEVLEGHERVDRGRIERLAGVARIVDAARELVGTPELSEQQPREVPLGSRATVGGRRLAVIAGPCSVEDEGRLLETAHAVAEAGATGLRGGAFKPRTSPYSFQGLGDAALEMLAGARQATGLAIVTEVMSTDQIARVAAVADVLQVGSRNMHNTPLLRALGEQDKPVLLKRGWSATLEELLQAAEYIRVGGNRNVILCERGIRTHERYVRNTLALAIVPEARRLSGLPMIVDPSHGTGRPHLIEPMCRAAVACGADGLLIEVHPEPDRAWSDGDQSLDPETFARLVQRLRPLAAACAREL